ncbi:MAG: hypothetical protein AAF283_05285 [Cyanobacteria bacterium P01_A01_bin.70]
MRTISFSGKAFKGMAKAIARAVYPANASASPFIYNRAPKIQEQLSDRFVKA